MRLVHGANKRIPLSLDVDGDGVIATGTTDFTIAQAITSLAVATSRERTNS